MEENQSPQTPPSQPANNLNKQNVSNLPINKKKFIFTILVFIFFLLATSAIVLRQTKTQQSQTPFSLPQVFSTQQECETKTSKSCIFQNCDYIPEGKTFEEVCGKNFQKGWVPTDNSTIQTDTPNWKTYSNEKLSFEFKYPSHILIPSECADGVNLYPSNSRMPWSQYCNSPFITLVYSEGELSLEQLDQSNFEVTTEKMTVAGLVALKQTIRKINTDIPGQELTIYVQFKNDKYFMFALKQQRFENEFTQILSTFKFLGKGSEANLKEICDKYEGVWLEDYSECESVKSDKGIDEELCIEKGGIFNECASNLGCRHSDSGKSCLPTTACIKLCNLKSEN